nr:Blp family class II bacteriocin [Streptococcus oralis]
MNTKMMSQFEIIDTDMLACVEGGFGGWGDMIAGLLGGLAPSPTLDQLNGK